ncbi:MAG: hypothetical protein LQ351_003137 [Letrouitia transgressa]|nr:MAG: hypothetical protein LQ351_003137 [Letrouitia transgressa]
MSSQQQWPPRSPQEALLSSPSGRRRLRRCQDFRSTSPSPLKKSSTTPNLSRAFTSQFQEAENDDEDEETLQLRLEALEARLKLKKLQQKKKTASSPVDVGKENKPLTNRTESESLGKPRSTQQDPKEIQIPVSPQRKNTVAEEQKSPGRVLLGIDKGLKSKDISLRNPTKTRRLHNEDPFAGTSAWTGGEIDSISSPGLTQSSQIGGPKSFSERIAETRRHDKEHKDRARRLQQQRSNGFGVRQEDIDRFKGDAAARAAETKEPSAGGLLSQRCEGFSRDDVLRAKNGSARTLPWSNTNSSERSSSSTRKFRNPNASPEFVKPMSTTRQNPRHRSTSPISSTKPRKRESSSSPDRSLFEPFSSIHLSKRLLPHDFLTRTFSQKSTLLLTDLLGAVKAPDYSLPDNLEPDYVVLAVIASKSSPLSHKEIHKKKESTETPVSSLTEAADSEANARGKYIAITLTDLKWTLDLYLFTTAYTRWRKLNPGTLIAILNPSIMPPPPHNPHNNRFSLALDSGDDTILEIGTSRDLGWCSSLRKDGTPCNSWIDKRHTSVCEFHVDFMIEKTKRGRMEVNGMSAPFAPGGRREGRTGFWGGGKGPKSKSFTVSKSFADFGRRGDGLLREGPQYDRTTGSTYFVGPSPGSYGRSAARLLDTDGAIERGGSREERVRKRMAEREREREIAQKLGHGGQGMGGEYLKMKHDNTAANSATNLSVNDGSSRLEEPVDAAALGLLAHKAVDIHLSPLKKKRPGTSFNQEVKKKTRFVTEKGIKEAGRDSFGAPEGRQGKLDDDDDLDIV